MNQRRADGVKKVIGRAFNQGELDAQDLRHIAAYCLERAGETK